MPVIPSQAVRCVSRTVRWCRQATALAAVLACASTDSAVAEGDAVAAVRSRQVEIQYRLDNASPNAEVELWYTRNRASTWQKWGTHKDHDRPIAFEAPAEGLYGFVLIVKDNGQQSAPPPDSRTQPQRRVFIDYTPPLAQWDSVEPAEAFVSRRIVHLRWTAHDANLSSRPISLWYQSSIEQTWYPIEQELPNSGQYDWTVPAHLADQVALKLAVRDVGGHIVERLHGPVSIDRWVARGIPLSKTSTRPAGGTALATRPAATQPAAAAPGFASSQARQKVEQLWTRGSWHAGRNEYAVAAERFREALEIDPTHVPSLYDLGVIQYYQKDYPKAIETFRSVLAQEAGHRPALRGMHESYIAQRQYAKSYEILQRLAKLDGKDAKTWLDLGDVLFMMERQADAREMWTKALSTDPAAADVIEGARTRLSQYGASTAGQANKDRPSR